VKVTAQVPSSGVSVAVILAAVPVDEQLTASGKPPVAWHLAMIWFMNAVVDGLDASLR